MDLILDVPAWFSSVGAVLTYEPSFDMSRFFGRIGVFTKWSFFCPVSYEKYSLHGPDDYVDVMNDDVIISDPVLYRNAIRFMVQLLTFNPSQSTITNSFFL